MATRDISPPENFEFRSSQIASDAILDKLFKQHAIITILNFKINSGWVGGNSRAPTPLYETLAQREKEGDKRENQERELTFRTPMLF